MVANPLWCKTTFKLNFEENMKVLVINDIKITTHSLNVVSLKKIHLIAIHSIVVGKIPKGILLLYSRFSNKCGSLCTVLETALRIFTYWKILGITVKVFFRYSLYRWIRPRYHVESDELRVPNKDIILTPYFVW